MIQCSVVRVVESAVLQRRKVSLENHIESATNCGCSSGKAAGAVELQIKPSSVGLL